MMGYLVDIEAKLNSMHDKRCHEDFRRLAEYLIQTNGTDMLPVLMNLINKYDSLSRYSLGIRKKYENAQYKLGAQRNSFAGGYHND